MTEREAELEQRLAHLEDLFKQLVFLVMPALPEPQRHAAEVLYQNSRFVAPEPRYRAGSEGALDRFIDVQIAKGKAKQDHAA